MSVVLKKNNQCIWASSCFPSLVFLPGIQLINCCSPIRFQKFCFPGASSSLPSQSVCPSYIPTYLVSHVPSSIPPLPSLPPPARFVPLRCVALLSLPATWLHRRCCCERQDYFPFLSSPPLSNIINSPFLNFLSSKQRLLFPQGQFQSYAPSCHYLLLSVHSPTGILCSHVRYVCCSWFVQARVTEMRKANRYMYAHMSSSDSTPS